MTEPHAPPEFDIAIIGAGLAGLTAALIVHEAGVRVVLLEGAGRIGGRIHAVFDADAKPIADLGPTWVWPSYQPVVAHWLERLGLTTFEQYNEGDGVIEGYGPGLQHQPLPGQHGMVRIVDGPQAMIDALASHLPEGVVRLEAKVTGIDETQGSGLRITLADEQGQVNAGQVILAVPLRVAAEVISIPSLSEEIFRYMRATPTWMAAQAKVVALYQRAFWREAGLSGRIASRLGPLGEVHDHCSLDGQSALFGFLDRSSAPQDRDMLHTRIKAQLGRCLGPQAGLPVDLIVQDWARKPLICSDLDRTGPSLHPEVGPAPLRAPHLGGRLWLGVSETSDLSPGLIEGALQAGERAALFALGADGP